MIDTLPTSPAYGRTPAEQARRIGPGRGGRETHVSSVIRWITVGVRLSDDARLRVRATRTPGGWRITDADMDAFLAAVTEDRLRRVGIGAVSPTPVRLSA